MPEIRLYIEGGGDDIEQRAMLRQGFEALFNTLRDQANAKNIDFRIAIYGPKPETYKNWKKAVKNYPERYNILLVDSDCAVNTDPPIHLLKHDKWRSRKLNNNNCHLMVQIMEAWLIADLDALTYFYGNGFEKDKISYDSDVELIDKKLILLDLHDATIRSEKGEYHKIIHGSKLLALIGIELVREKALHCDRLFKTLESFLNSAAI